jgi:hypothetical protein
MACTDVATTKAKIPAMNLIMVSSDAISGCRSPGAIGANVGAEVWKRR